MKRSQEVKISFPLANGTVFFDTTCTKLNLVHAFLFERVRNRALRTECAKIMFDTRNKNDSDTNIEKYHNFTMVTLVTMVTIKKVF